MISLHPISSSHTAAAVNGSKKFIGRATVTPSYIFYGDMQAAADGKIYFTKSESYYLGCIPFPNLPGPLCGFMDNGLFLGGQRGLIGLPNEVRFTDTIHELDMGSDASLCYGAQLVLQAPPSPFYTFSLPGQPETGSQLPRPAVIG